MAKRSRTSRRRKGLGDRLLLVVRSTANNMGFVVLVAAVMFAMAAVGVASHDIPTSAASGKGPDLSQQSATPGATPGATPATASGPLKATCGLDGLPACQDAVRRIPLKSQVPADIIAAAKQSPLFTVDRSGGGDFIHDLSHLGTPQLVRALHAAGKKPAPDFFVIPIDDSGGVMIGAAQLALDEGHTSIVVASITTFATPRSNNTIAQSSADNALASLQAQTHVGLKAGAAPYLVYFPTDYYARITGKIVWTSGGTSPLDPIWDIPGADGKDHVVDTAGHVYDLSQLPISDG